MEYSKNLAPGMAQTSNDAPLDYEKKTAKSIQHLVRADATAALTAAAAISPIITAADR